MKSIVTIIFSAISAVGLAQIPGTLDASFGNNGYTFISLSQNNHNIGGVDIASNDDIVIGGYTVGSNDDLVLAKTDNNGQPMASFGNNGGITYDLTIGANERILDMATLPNGKVIACGIIDGNFTKDILLVRFEANGNLDNSFGNNGYLTYHISGDDYGTVIKISNNNIYIAGYNYMGNANKDQFVLRLTMEGLLDQSFATGGLALVDINNNSDDYLRDFIICPDGSTLLVGMTKTGQTLNATITRLTASGQIDPSFANNGTFIYTESTLNTHLLSVALSGTGDILLSGYYIDANSDEVAVLFKLDVHGTLDNTFAASSGIVKFNHTSANDDERFNLITVLDDGEIMVCGQYRKSQETEFKPFVALYSSGGDLIKTFADSGLYFIPLPNAYSNMGVYNVAQQSDKRFILAGTLFNTQGNRRELLLMRLDKKQQTQNISTNPAPEIKFDVYPNPASNKVEINISGIGDTEVQVFCYNSCGAIVRHIKTNRNISHILVDDLSAGTYFINVHTKNGISAGKRLVVQ